MPKNASSAKWSLESYCIGMKLRSLRAGKRLTLAQLAEETGLSTALLSKLETDRLIPTLPTLANIACVYGVGMSYFFRDSARHSLSITRKAHLESRALESANALPLNANRAGFRLNAKIVEFPPGRAALAMNADDEGSAVVYVLEGRLLLEAGCEREVLDTGDCMCVESDMPLAWGAAGNQRCRVLAVLPAK